MLLNPNVGVKRAGAVVGGAAVAGLAVAGTAAGSRTIRALGASKSQIARHIAGSSHQTGGVFDNLEPSRPVTDGGSAARAMLSRGRTGQPRKAIPLDPVLAPSQPAELAATWLGHASVLIELDGRRILTDPVFSGRVSPSSLIGPTRMHPTPCAVADLPQIDIVVISHDHYDHLDMPTVRTLAALHPAAQFVTPIGVGAHLVAWGIGAQRIHQADWGGRITLGDISFDACSARHFSGRGLQRNLTQWVSWAITGPRHNVFFTGDTGFTEAYADHGRAHGPFALTLVPIGAYSVLWPDIHLNPEEAVRVHRLLNPDGADDSVLLPIHWATFNLALHDWAEPAARLRSAAADLTVYTPKPGGRIDILKHSGAGVADQAWWESVA